MALCYVHVRGENMHASAVAIHTVSYWPPRLIKDILCDHTNHPPHAHDAHATYVRTYVQWACDHTCMHTCRTLHACIITYVPIHLFIHVHTCTGWALAVRVHCIVMMPYPLIVILTHALLIGVHVCMYVCMYTCAYWRGRYMHMHACTCMYTEAWQSTTLGYKYKLTCSYVSWHNNNVMYVPLCRVRPFNCETHTVLWA